MFIEFNTAEEAERAKNIMDRHPFDARHRFQITLLADLESIVDMDETFTEPEPEVFKSKVVLDDMSARPYLISIIGTFASLVGRSSRKGPICHLPFG